MTNQKKLEELIATYQNLKAYGGGFITKEADKKLISDTAIEITELIITERYKING